MHSSICPHFVQNAWRKDICSNCFQLRDEHSVKLSTTTADLNHYNSTHHNSNNNQYQEVEGNGVSGGKNSGSSPINNNHSISILVKTPDSNNTSKMPTTGRYQSPTTGIPRVNSYRYSSSNLHHNASNNSLSSSTTSSSSSPSSTNSKSFYSGSSSSYNQTEISKGSKRNTTNSSNPSAEVIRVASSPSSKKVMTHPLKGDNNNTHRTVNNVLNGTSSPSSSASSTVVSVNGVSASKHSSNSSINNNIPSHYNGNHSSNAHNSSHSVTNETSNNRDGSERSCGSGASTVVVTNSSQTKNNNNNNSNQSQKNWNGNHQSINDSNNSKLPSSTTTANIVSMEEKHVKSSTGSKLHKIGNMENCVSNNSGNKSVLQRNSNKVDAPDGEIMNGHGKRSKGILKADGKHRRKLSVKFPKEVCKVIGYGGKYSVPLDESESEEEEDVPDPQDVASIAELLASNSVTVEEKEMLRVTVKNTNFNSIKTNLLGYAPIGIDGIIGHTGGKSMENSSKPLVSIGTFESRKQPLRIIRKCGGDDDDEDVDVIKEFNRKEKEVVVGKVTTTTTYTKNISNSNNNNNTYNNNSNSVSSNVVKKTTNDTKSEVSKSQSLQKVNTATTPTDNNVVVNVNTTTATTTANAKMSQPLSPPTSNSQHEQRGGNDVKINGKNIVTGSSISNGISTIEVNPEKSSIKITTGATTTVSPVEVVEKRSQQVVNNKPKPILKNNQLSTEATAATTNSEMSLSLNSGISSNSGNNNNNSKNSDNSENFSSSPSSSTSSPPLSNLIILNGGNIASKRTSFLKEIISPELQQPVTVLTRNMNNHHHQLQEPVVTTIVGSIAQDVMSTPSLTLETDSLEVVVQNSNISHSIMHPLPKPDVQIDSKLHGSVTTTTTTNHHMKGIYSCFEDNGSEFDDSLEDSGLDIASHEKSNNNNNNSNNNKSRGIVENSESDDNDAEKFEKFGSQSSDSGNDENDYNDRIVVPSHGGLYISVDEDGKNQEDSSKPKLSPDSVLFSSASEMSASGSSESIPECVNVHVVTSNVVKRPAPLPPTNSKPKTTTEYEENEEVYDDIASYQHDRRQRLKKQENHHHDDEEDDENENDEEEEGEEEEEEEESIYDDCTAISYANNNNNNNNTSGKSVGSYDFTNGARKMLDTDGHDSAETIPLRASDGIEFIGIRKIDSETHLNATIEANTPPSPEDNTKRSNSVSPKARRKVNHFFSTIGKKAGAAFSSSHSPLSGGTVSFMRNKSPSPAPLSSAYKRSMSQDEVSMTRTQELYATITPTSLKFKGLAPVLQKLSRMDMMDPSGGSGSSGKNDDGKDPKEKMFKKHKILPSMKNIKSFLRMGSTGGKDDEFGIGSEERTSPSSSSSYAFKTESKNSSPMTSDSSSASSSSFGASSESSSSPPSLDHIASNSRTSQTISPPMTTATATSTLVKPPIAARPTQPISRPPPPPPRIHSLELLNKACGAANGPNGTVKPARPPPPTMPVRSNRIAPSFTSVFAASSSTDEGDMPRDPGPPNKPKRKASMNGHNHLMRNNTITAASTPSTINNNDGELSLESNVTSLNFETLKLIASQPPKKIKRKSTQNLAKFSASPIGWSNFYVSDMEPMAKGDRDRRFAFYPALWDHEPCVLLLQDSSDDSSSYSLQLSCVEISAKFVDNVPISFAPWMSSDYTDEGNEVKVSISVLPSCSVQPIEKYIGVRSFASSMQKYFALLQVLDFWGREEICDLLVVQAGNSKDEEMTPADLELVYVIPTSNNKKSKRSSSSSYSQLSSNFEIHMKQLLLQPQVLGEYDRQVLFRVISGGSSKEVEAQLKLFLQAKLFGHRIKPEDMERLRRNKSDRILTQYLEKERAQCMRDAIARSFATVNSEPISPLKARFVEFLMLPDLYAKLVLELVLDLFFK